MLLIDSMSLQAQQNKRVYYEKINHRTRISRTNELPMGTDGKLGVVPRGHEFRDATYVNLLAK
ncbi:hypothetical protein BCU12_04330 [Vibrio sp. 10N.261.55.A7]|nr:hypothetical protein BCU12_04330 [Vibrio sp. 10N.261.55.A7]